MKKLILSSDTILASSYKDILKAICNDLCNQGKNAVINTGHRCVDVLDSSGTVIEQHYPELDHTTKSTRGKFIYVGPGNGTHICTSVSYDRKHYKAQNHLMKSVSKVSRVP